MTFHDNMRYSKPVHTHNYAWDFLYAYAKILYVTLSVVRDDIHSIILDISIVLLLLRGTPDTARILCRSFTPKCHRQPHAVVSEGLAQGLYMVARMGFEPTTLRSTAIDSTNEPPRPTRYDMNSIYFKIHKLKPTSQNTRKVQNKKPVQRHQDWFLCSQNHSQYILFHL